MSEPLDLNAIPPAPSAGQLWRINGDLWHVLSVAPGKQGIEVVAAVYRSTKPVTLLAKSFEPVVLRQFVERTHGKDVELVEGPGAPWKQQSKAAP